MKMSHNCQKLSDHTIETYSSAQHVYMSYGCTSRKDEKAEDNESVLASKPVPKCAERITNKWCTIRAGNNLACVRPT